MQQNIDQDDPGNFDILTLNMIGDQKYCTDLQSQILQSKILDERQLIVVNKKGGSNVVHASGFGGQTESSLSRQQLDNINNFATPDVCRTAKDWCATALSELNFGQYDSAYQFICEAIKEIEKFGTQG